MPLLSLQAFDLFGMESSPAVTLIPTCLLGLVVMGLNRRYRRIGDFVAGTIVVVEERSWLMGVAKLEDPRTAQLASILPPKFRVNRDLAKALSAYVERRRYFSQARRGEI